MGGCPGGCPGACRGQPTTLPPIFGADLSSHGVRWGWFLVGAPPPPSPTPAGGLAQKACARPGGWLHGGAGGVVGSSFAHTSSMSLHLLGGATRGARLWGLAGLPLLLLLAQVWLHGRVAQGLLHPTQHMWVLLPSPPCAWLPPLPRGSNTSHWACPRSSAHSLGLPPAWGCKGDP